MVGRCMRENQGFGVVLESFDVGTLAKIVDFHRLSDGFLGLSCVGQQRFRILARSRQADGLNLAEVEWLKPEPTVAVPARHARLAELLKNVLPQLGEVYEGFEMRADDAAWVGTGSPNTLHSARGQAILPGAQRPDSEARRTRAPGVGNHRSRVNHTAAAMAIPQGSIQ